VNANNAEVMKMSRIELLPATLIEGLKRVKPAVAMRTSVNALSGVRIFKRSDGEAAGDGLRIYATDMDISVCRILPPTNTIEGDVDFVVAHTDLAKAAELLKRADVIALEPTSDGTNVVVTGGTRTITLRTLRLQDHPEWKPHAGELAFIKNRAELRAVIERAITFTSKDETRPVLTGVLFDLKADEPLTFCATDSYRLGVLTLPGSKAHATAQVNVPARLLATALKGAKGNGSVAVYITHDRVSLDNLIEGETWIGRVIVGQYPNYRQLIPEGQTFVHELTVPTAEMRSACELAVSFARRNAPMRLSVNGTTKVCGSTPDEASFEEELPGAKHLVDGRDATIDDYIEFGLNPTFMRDLTKITQSEDMVIRMISPLRPALVEDQDDRYLIMPIRLNV
jgi:DNA polymerase-3 subunit beta